MAFNIRVKMKSTLQVIDEMCGTSNVCLYNIKEIIAQTGRDMKTVYDDILRLTKTKYISIFKENGTQYIRTKGLK